MKVLWAISILFVTFLCIESVILGRKPFTSYSDDNVYSSRGREETESATTYLNNPNKGDGSFSYRFDSDSGISAQQEAYLKEDVPEGPGSSVQGSYSYVGPDGKEYTVYYTADENGYVVHGDHLPTPHPSPPAILAALKKNEEDEANGIVDNGTYQKDSSGDYKPDSSGSYKPGSYYR